jgi:signal transduction histidine kinase
LQKPAWTSAIDDWSKTTEHDPLEGFLSEQVEIGQRVVNVRLSPVRNEDQFLGTVFVLRDVTKEFEADRLKSEFISNVSHELRTPLTSIKGYVDLLALGAVGPLADQQKDFVGKIKGNAERLGILVDDLLNISVHDSGKEQLNLEDVNLTRVLENVTSTVQGRAEHENKDMDVILNIAPDLPTIMGDTNKLTQVFTNLVDNAFNYTYAGGTIEVTAQQQDDNMVQVSVRDTGIGIPDDFKDRVWERFGRYEEHALVMDVPGTGLGLPIVKALVEMHKGEIWFESESGVGTTFFVTLPIQQQGE